MTEMWAIVELMGHVRVAGRVTEEEYFGAKLGRIDIPIAVETCQPCQGKVGVNPACTICAGQGATGGGFATQFFGGGSVYRITPVSEQVARAAAAICNPAPVSPWGFLKALPAASAHASADRDDEYDAEEDADDGLFS